MRGKLLALFPLRLGFLHGIRRNLLFFSFWMASSSFATHFLTLTDDSSSPYFLHHGDNPSIILVSQLLDGDNYNSWSRSMKIALWAKNKLGFVNGTLILSPNSSNPTLDAWLRCNNMVFLGFSISLQRRL